VSDGTIHHYSAGRPHTGLDLYVSDDGELVLYCSADDTTWTLPSATPVRRAPGDSARRDRDDPLGGPGVRAPGPGDGVQGGALLDDLRSDGTVVDGP